MDKVKREINEFERTTTFKPNLVAKNSYKSPTARYNVKPITSRNFASDKVDLFKQ